MRLFIIFMFTFVALPLLADPLIFDVRKPIAMSEKESPQKDFYINAGSESGLQAGTIVTAVRKMPLYDSYQSRSAGDLTVPVAKLRIIHVQQGLSVARFESEIPRKDIPILEDNFILVGDRLDMATVTHDKRSAQNEGDAESTEAPHAAPAPAPVAEAAPPPPAAPMPAPVTAQVTVPVTSQVTSQKIESAPLPAKDNSPGVKPIDGPTVR